MRRGIAHGYSTPEVISDAVGCQAVQNRAAYSGVRRAIDSEMSLRKLALEYEG